MEWAELPQKARGEKTIWSKNEEISNKSRMEKGNTEKAEKRK